MPESIFQVTLLVCALAVQPADCDQATARQVLSGPESRSAVACGLLSQAYLANSALGQALGKDEYLKIRCKRQHDAPSQQVHR